MAYRLWSSQSNNRRIQQLFSPQGRMPQLVFSWNPAELGSNASKGMNLQVRVRKSRQREGDFFSSMSFLQTSPKSVAKSRGRSSHLRRSGLKVCLCGRPASTGQGRLRHWVGNLSLRRLFFFFSESANLILQARTDCNWWRLLLIVARNQKKGEEIKNTSCTPHTHTLNG